MRSILRLDPFLETKGNIHVLNRAEPDIRFIVQIEADVGRSEVIALVVYNKLELV